MRRTAWLICACLALSATAAVAGSPLVGDFDGDGRRDRATFERQDPSILRVWLSATRTTAIVQAGAPILALAARDLDGDHRDELIASGASGLQIWSRSRDRFAAVHPRRPASPSLGHRGRHSVDDGSEPRPAAVFADGPLLALAATPRAHRPWRVSVPAPARAPAAARSCAIHPPFAPRPPPFGL